MNLETEIMPQLNMQYKKWLKAWDYNITYTHKTRYRLMLNKLASKYMGPDHLIEQLQKGQKLLKITEISISHQS